MKFSLPFLRIDAQLAVVEAALRGWAEWLIGQSNTGIVGRYFLKTVHKS